MRPDRSAIEARVVTQAARVKALVIPQALEMLDADNALPIEGACDRGALDALDMACGIDWLVRVEEIWHGLGVRLKRDQGERAFSLDLGWSFLDGRGLIEKCELSQLRRHLKAGAISPSWSACAYAQGDELSALAIAPVDAILGALGEAQLALADVARAFIWLRGAPESRGVKLSPSGILAKVRRDRGTAYIELPWDLLGSSFLGRWESIRDDPGQVAALP